ncbi:MAG: potassium/proton antiporter [Methanobrevibacter sp.]|jgi:cell volume regulation protein A|nr:potassium/proton antiporter [Methanobrevibacter sp.]
MISIELLLLGAGLLLIISVLLSKASSMVGFPTLIVFLIIGMLLGSDGIVGIYFDNYLIVQYISIFAMIIIMFSGGIDTDFKRVRSIAAPGVILSTIGVLITAIATGLFIHYIIGLDIIVSLLIGSIISATDVAAVFSIFRPSNLKLKNNLDGLLEIESATNDPMAYVLTTSFIYLALHPTTSVESIIFLLIQSLVIGLIIGYFSGKLSAKLINFINLNSRGLYPVLLIGVAILTFACAELIGGNGFLAVYISSLLIGNSVLVNKRSQINFFDGLAWLMQITMFIILGLLVFPKQLLPTAGISLIIAIGLILIARPLSVFLCLIPSKFNLKEKVFLSWTGIKGAVPIVFATYPLVANISDAPMIFNIVFFITIISVILQGSTVKFLAKKLNLIENIK